MIINELEDLINRRAVGRATQSVFTDRLPLAAAFDSSVQYLLDEVQMRPPSSQVDLSVPRRNVLHFFGVGGIGKSALLRQLAHRTRDEPDASPSTPGWAKFPFAGKRILSGSFDIAQSTSTIESLVLKIRASLSPLGSEYLRPFDILLGRYWLAQHPGQDIRASLRSSSEGSQVALYKLMSEQIAVSLEQAAAAAFGHSLSASGAVSFISSISSKVLDALSLRRIGVELPFFQDLIDAPPDGKSLPFYPMALAWAIANVNPSKPHQFVFFIDHLEQMGENMERQVNQLIWSVPNALFVLAGRNQLDWAKRYDGSLFRGGAEHWPHLASELAPNPRQHRLGNLSQPDSETFLRASISEKTSLEQDDIAAIAANSKGLPLHLELVVQHLWTASGPLDVKAIATAPFREIGRRAVQDLSSQEQMALYVVATLEEFDPQALLESADTNELDGIRSLITKPIVEYLPEALIPFRVERSMVEVLFDVLSKDEAEISLVSWKRICTRVFEYALDQVEAGKQQLFWFRQALRLAIGFGFESSRLFEGVASVLKKSNWDTSWRVAEMPWSCASEELAAELRRLAQAVELVMSRQLQDRGTVASSLGELLSHIEVDDERFDFARYFMAEALRDSGQVDQASSVLSSIRDSKRPWAREATHASAHILRRQGKFIELRCLLDENSALPKIERLRADYEWPHGSFQAAVANYELAAQRANAKGDKGEEQLCLAFRAWMLTLCGNKQAEEAAQEVSTSSVIYSSFTRVLTNLSLALVEFERSGQDVLFNDWRDVAQRFRHTSLVVYSSFGKFIICLRKGEPTDEVLQQVKEDSEDAGIRYLLPIAEAMVDRNQASFDAIDWAQDDVLKRWKSETV